nr:hypothetical protein [Nesterenkonia muleiensis]
MPLFEFGSDHGVVQTVAAESAELVDDDGIDVFDLADPFKHLLELNPLGDFSG